VSARRRPERAPPSRRRWGGAVDPDACFLSVVTLFEIELGIQRLERRDQRQAIVLREWLDDYLRPLFRPRLLTIDEAVAIACAALHVPTPRPYRDALIAATAIVHRLAGVTRNTRDFGGLPVAIVDPWEGKDAGRQRLPVPTVPLRRACQKRMASLRRRDAPARVPPPP
jgi:predicted nucleic acid-binding protein